MQSLESEPGRGGASAVKDTKQMGDRTTQQVPGTGTSLEWQAKATATVGFDPSKQNSRHLYPISLFPSPSHVDHELLTLPHREGVRRALSLPSLLQAAPP